MLLKVNKKRKSLNILGFGVAAYFAIHRYLMLIFFIIVLLSMPSIWYFCSNNDINVSAMGLMTQYTIGNIGNSEASWTDVSLEDKYLNVGCLAGKAKSIFSYGVNPLYNLNNDACVSSKLIETWDSIIDHELVKKTITEKWINQKYWEINNVNIFLKKEGGPPFWIDNLAQFYLQLTCEFSDEQLETRNYWNIWFWIQLIISSLVILILILYLKRVTEFQYLEWDEETTLVSDYTLKYKIPSKVYKDFWENVYPSYKRNLAERKSSHMIIKQRTRNYEDESNDNIGEDSLMYMFKLFLK